MYQQIIIATIIFKKNWYNRSIDKNNIEIYNKPKIEVTNMQFYEDSAVQ